MLSFGICTCDHLREVDGDVLAVGEDVHLPSPLATACSTPKTSPLWAVWCGPLAAPCPTPIPSWLEANPQPALGPTSVRRHPPSVAITTTPGPLGPWAQASFSSIWVLTGVCAQLRGTVPVYLKQSGKCAGHFSLWVIPGQSLT